MIIIGTDEAGYGPNLGPLVVSLTAWEADAEDLSPLFAPLKQAGIPIGDSKKLYHGSLTTLETSVLVPMQSLQGDIFPAFEAILQQHRVRLLDMQYRSIEPEEFNRLLDQFDSKGSLLSNVTLRLIAHQLAKYTHNNVLVLCDKHGGRNRYLDLLTEFFPGEFIQVIQESRESSIYRLISEDRQGEFRFLAKGESHLPIALASMLSKYQRELAMLRFNAFWQSHIPDLRPTAGYPEDAQRFKRQIADAQERLGIAEDHVWRKR
ncbi:MAG: hypothetical protein FWE95_03570 [Planctomycetaceae bacterium]|nr:hypothetical protein [Planctomycetaceae bacterium]